MTEIGDELNAQNLSLITSFWCLSKFQSTMAAGHKSLLVRLVSSDCIELGVKFSAPSSELNFELLSSAFVHQLVADLPSHEVISDIIKMSLIRFL